MKYILNGRETYDSAREAAEEIAEWLREEEYDAVLDKLCEPFIVGGAEIEASFVLKRDSPGAYLRGFHDWVSKKKNAVLSAEKSWVTFIYLYVIMV